jgi:DNA repair exonuclease SbcCD nuclease subunit
MSETPYGLMSDLHAHSWSSFAGVDGQGRNTRLMHIIHEIHRCCAEVRRRGGERVVVAGDVFHTRGSVSPSVFNPLRQALADEVERGMAFIIMPGNHDLEGKTSQSLTSAVAMLQGLPRVSVFHRPIVMPSVALVPWEPDLEKLLATATTLGARCQSDMTDLILHTGIDGVLTGMPDHGLTPDRLADLGFRRVFAGHYHHHKDMGRGVWSIGAPTHQTWSDVGSRAGWLIVSEGAVEFFSSHAPRFLDLSGEEDAEELPLIVDGHYVRARVAEATSKQVTELRETLVAMGALGVLVQSVPAKTAGTRTISLSGAALASLDRAVADYCATRGLGSTVIAACDSLLKEARS